MTEPPDWAISTPSSEGVHTEPAKTVQWVGPSQEQMRQLRQQLLESILAWVVQAVKGLFIPGGGFGSAYSQLEDWANSLLDEAGLGELTGLDFSSPGAFAGSLVTLIGEAIGIDLHELGAIFAEIDMSSPSAFLASLAQALLDLGLWLTKLSPLNALNLFNLVPTDLMAQISHSNIGTAITNLITDPHFLDSEALSAIEGWLHNPTGGLDGTGSMSVTADGTTHELLGNLIPVSENQVLPIKTQSKWTGLTGTGNPIAVAITGYQDGAATVQATVASHNTTPPTTDWTLLSGNYTVPANVDSLRTRLVVGPTATAGTVSFSQVSATKIGPVLQRLIAGTGVGELLPDDIENLFTGVVTNALSLLEKVEQSAHDALLEVLGGDLGEIDDRLNDFLHSLSPLNGSNITTGAIGNQFVPGLNTIHDAVVTAVGRLSGSGFDIVKVMEALTGQTNSVISNATGMSILHGRLATAESKLAALPVSLGGTGVGISYGGIVGCNDTDEFERVSSTSLGPTWTQYYSSGGGVWATPNGHDAEYMWSGTSDREFIAIRNNTSLPRSLTDYQRVTLVLSSKATRHYDSVFGTYNYVGHNDVWLRVSDATTSMANVTGIRIRFGGDGGISVVRFLTGTPTTLKSYPTGTYNPPGPGATLIGEAGDINGVARYFRGIFGNSVAIEVTETGTASGFGAAFRRWGHGGRVEGWSGLFDNGQERPGTLHHWNGMDQVFA